MLGAAAAVQKLFWKRYNLARPRRRPPSPLREVLAQVVDERLGRMAESHPRIREAWAGVAPDEFLALTAVAGCRQGVLRIVVDGAATRFSLRRKFGGPRLVSALNAALGEPLISRIVFEISDGRGQRGRRAN